MESESNVVDERVGRIRVRRGWCRRPSLDDIREHAGRRRSGIGLGSRHLKRNDDRPRTVHNVPMRHLWSEHGI